MSTTKLTFLGTGTSQGVPIIGCHCEVCSSPDPKDKRYRSSAFVEYQGLKILIDAGPDFRSQMLRADISHLDAVLITHGHKDHTGGLDDVRSLNYTDKRAVEIFCEENVYSNLKHEYPYAFAEEKYPGAPEWEINLIENKPFIVTPNTDDKKLVWVHDVGYRYALPDGSLIPPKTQAEWAKSEGEGGLVIPIRGHHHDLPVLGFRFGKIAYITDMSSISDEEIEKLQGLEHVTLNTVGYKKHHSHFSLEEAMVLADRIGAKRTWLTHLSHSFPKDSEFCKELEELCGKMGIRSVVKPAYDGLTIEG